MILLLISFVAGILTVLAPCVLPLLPVIVGGSISGETSSRRAAVISISLGVSVVLFTLLLKVSTVFINVPQSFWEWFSGGILIIFGVIMVYPQLWDSLGIVNLMNRGSNQLLASGYQKNSFWGDVIMGAALGPVFSSCSPTYFVILATVLPASFGMGLLDLVVYAIGLSGFLLLIAVIGQRLVDKLGVAINPEGWFRKGIGILFILIGLAVATGSEASTEAWLFTHGFDVTVIEQKLLGATSPSTTLQPTPIADDSLATTTDATSSSADAPASGTASTMPPAVSNAMNLLSIQEKSKMYPKAPELVSPDGYINTGTDAQGNALPITIGQFKGKKVVLIDIWTYSCINCQRTLPYIKAWYDKYHDQGLEIIGVHTPEFAFEHVLSNVQNAVAQFGIKYPVVLDNEYKTWNAFGNQYWPRKYLIDIDGFIVYDHAGEGNYDVTEAAIQKALAERDARLGISAQMPTGVTAPQNVVTVDDTKLGSPETYFGSARNEYLTNGTQGQNGPQTLTIPQTLTGNALYLGGTWNFADEYAQNQSANAQIKFMYQAKNVYFVAASDKPVKIKVTRDGGQVLGSAAGADVDANGEATIQANKLYHLIGDSTYGVHTIEITVEGTGLQAYTFTFG